MIICIILKFHERIVWIVQFCGIIYPSFCKTYSDEYYLQENYRWQEMLFNYSLRNISIYKEKSYSTSWCIPWTFASTQAICGTFNCNLR